MKVLVIGREGQLARGLVETAGAGVQVVAIGRPELDLTDEKSVAAAVARERPDIVVNAAAYTGVDKAETEPALAHAVNALGRNMLQQPAPRMRSRSSTSRRIMCSTEPRTVLMSKTIPQLPSMSTDGPSSRASSASPKPVSGM